MTKYSAVIQLKWELIHQQYALKSAPSSYFVLSVFSHISTSNLITLLDQRCKCGITRWKPSSTMSGGIQSMLALGGMDTTDHEFRAECHVRCVHCVRWRRRWRRQHQSLVKMNQLHFKINRAGTSASVAELGLTQELVARPDDADEVRLHSHAHRQSSLLCKPTSLACKYVTEIRLHSTAMEIHAKTALKPGFHYPSWRVTGFHYPSTQPVLTGNGNRSPVNSGSGNRALLIQWPWPLTPNKAAGMPRYNSLHHVPNKCKQLLSC